MMRRTWSIVRCRICQTVRSETLPPQNTGVNLRNVALDTVYPEVATPEHGASRTMPIQNTGVDLHSVGLNTVRPEVLPPQNTVRPEQCRSRTRV